MTPSHIASCSSTETAGPATVHKRTDLHNSELLNYCAVISLLPVLYYAILVCSIVLRTLCVYHLMFITVFMVSLMKENSSEFSFQKREL